MARQGYCTLLACSTTDSGTALDQVLTEEMEEKEEDGEHCSVGTTTLPAPEAGDRDFRYIREPRKNRIT